MIFVPYNSRKIESVSFPTFVINGNNLEFVKQFKYLGHIITCTLPNSIDIDSDKGVCLQEQIHLYVVLLSVC